MTSKDDIKALVSLSSFAHAYYSTVHMHVLALKENSRIPGMQEFFWYFSSKLNFYGGENFLKCNLAALGLLPYSTVYCLLRGIDVDVCCGR